jgi:hypothetical protein
LRKAKLLLENAVLREPDLALPIVDVKKYPSEYEDEALLGMILTRERHPTSY